MSVSAGWQERRVALLQCCSAAVLVACIVQRLSGVLKTTSQVCSEAFSEDILPVLIKNPSLVSSMSILKIVPRGKGSASSARIQVGMGWRRQEEGPDSSNLDTSSSAEIWSLQALLRRSRRFLCLTSSRKVSENISDISSFSLRFSRAFIKASSFK